MIKILLAFFVLSVLLFVGIYQFRSATAKERWNTVKTLAYAMVISSISVGLLSIFVILF